ncbi:MAG: YdcF family protein [Clostridiales bacterium]|nr:YdcF family protein [Clostridiales bacterium]
MINRKNAGSALRITACIVTFCLMAALCSCTKEAGTESAEKGLTTEKIPLAESVSGDPDTIQKYIEEMVVDYGSYGEEADNKVDELLNELSSVDTDAGIRWAKIMDLWRSDDLGQPLNYDVLPDGLPDTDELCIVVLGFQLNPDGSMKDELINRLTVAYNSAVKYPDSYIVCTGGGTATENESVTEAGMMVGWLIDQGIEEDRIIVEDDSLTTAQNAIYTYDILTSDYPSVKYIAIIKSSLF